MQKEDIERVKAASKLPPPEPQSKKGETWAGVFAASAGYGACYFVAMTLSKITAMFDPYVEGHVYTLVAGGFQALFGEPIGGSVGAAYGGQSSADGPPFANWVTGLTGWIRTTLSLGPNSDEAKAWKKFMDDELDKVCARLGETIPRKQTTEGETADSAESSDAADSAESSDELKETSQASAAARMILRVTCENTAYFMFSLAYMVSGGLQPVWRTKFGGSKLEQKALEKALDWATTTVCGFLGSIGTTLLMSVLRKKLGAPAPTRGLQSGQVRPGKQAEAVALLNEAMQTRVAIIHQIAGLKKAIAETDDDKERMQLNADLKDKKDELSECRKDIKEFDRQYGLLKTYAGRNLSILDKNYPVTHWGKKDKDVTSIRGKIQGAPILFRTLGKFLGRMHLFYFFTFYLGFQAYQLSTHLPYAGAGPASSGASSNTSFSEPTNEDYNAAVWASMMHGWALIGCWWPAVTFGGPIYEIVFGGAVAGTVMGAANTIMGAANKVKNWWQGGGSKDIPLEEVVIGNAPANDKTTNDGPVSDVANIDPNEMVASLAILRNETPETIIAELVDLSKELTEEADSEG